MEDEACTTYGGVIDQMTLGHQFLQQTFGDVARPTKGWQIGMSLPLLLPPALTLCFNFILRSFWCQQCDTDLKQARWI
jgi:hypothetical protein